MLANPCLPVPEVEWSFEFGPPSEVWPPPEALPPLEAISLTSSLGLMYPLVLSYHVAVTDEPIGEVSGVIVRHGNDLIVWQ